MLVAALCLAHETSTRRASEYIAQLDRGQIPPSNLLQLTSEETLILNGVKYLLKCTRTGRSQYQLSCNGSFVVGEVKQERSDGGWVVSLGRHTHTAYILKEVSGMRLRLDRHSCLFTEEYNPTMLRAAMAGKLSRYLVPNGTHLNRGDSFAELEAMKMYMNLRVGEACTVFHSRSEGTVVEAGDLLATAVLDDPDKVKCYFVTISIFSASLALISDEQVKLSELFKENLPSIETSRPAPHMPHLNLREAVAVIKVCVTKHCPT